MTSETVDKHQPQAAAGKEIASDKAERDATSVRRQPLGSRRRRLLRDTIIVVLLSALVTAGVLWWREVPLRRAQRFLEAGDAAKALSWTEYYLSYYANDSRAQSIKAQALVALERPEEAIALFDKPEVGVRQLDDTYLFARAYMMVEQWTRAVPLLHRVLQLNPNHPDALYEITTCRMRLGFLSEALQTARRYAELPGHEARGQLLVAVIENDLGNYSAAIEAYARALTASPTGEGWQLPQEAVYAQYAAALLKAGKAQEAVELLEDQERTPIICTALGDAYSQSGNLDEAIKAWEEALKLEPANLMAREGLANAALQKNEPDKAIELLAPLTSAPESALKASSAYLLQMAYSRIDPAAGAKWQEITSRLRHRDQQMAKFERVLLTAPHSNAALLIRAHRFASVGNFVQAEDLLRELLRVSPKDPLANDLVAAIRDRSPLPSLDRLAINIPQQSEVKQKD